MLHYWLNFALMTYFVLTATQQTQLLIHSALNVERTNAVEHLVCLLSSIIINLLGALHGSVDISLNQISLQRAKSIVLAKKSL